MVQKNRWLIFVLLAKEGGLWLGMTSSLRTQFKSGLM